MTFQIELVSPESISYSGEAEMVVARTLDGGDIAFQPGHVPFIGVLAVWSVDVIRPDGDRDTIAVHQGFVQRHADRSEATYAGLVPEGLRECLAERYADVLDRVVGVDLEVSVAPHLQAEATVAPQLVEHVVEEGDAGISRHRSPVQGSHQNKPSEPHMKGFCLSRQQPSRPIF